MAEIQLLGLFQEAGAAGDAIAQLRQIGVSDDKITVMSGVPYAAPILGRPRERHPLLRVTLAGTTLGLLTALFLTAGIYLLYQLNQGNQPLIPIPPSLIIFFEVTMLGTMGLTFVGLFLVNRFPVLKPNAYDPLITEGAIGVAAVLEEALFDRAEGLFNAAGATQCRRVPASPKRDTRNLIFWGVVGVLALGGLVIWGLWAYDFIKVDFYSQMIVQPSVDYDQAPRLAAPLSAVPVQGPELIAGQPATEPLPTTTASVQRGQVLFGINCALCHGATGLGDGKVGAFFAPTKPANLTSTAEQSLSPNQFFAIISQGAGLMPPLAENLTVAERWDLINYVHTLPK